MSCGSASKHMFDLLGSTNDQVDNSIHGVVAPASFQYQIPSHQGSIAGQVGGKGRRSRRNKRRHTSKRHKRGSYRRKSRKMIRKRK
jgi:hypothetical protein